MQSSVNNTDGFNSILDLRWAIQMNLIYSQEFQNLGFPLAFEDRGGSGEAFEVRLCDASDSKLSCMYKVMGKKNQGRLEIYEDMHKEFRNPITCGDICKIMMLAKEMTLQLQHVSRTLDANEIKISPKDADKIDAAKINAYQKYILGIVNTCSMFHITKMRFSIEHRVISPTWGFTIRLFNAKDKDKRCLYHFKRLGRQNLVDMYEEMHNLFGSVGNHGHILADMSTKMGTEDYCDYETPWNR